jgi:hypothetical protein
MHLAHVSMSACIRERCEGVGAGGCGRYWWQLAIAERNAGELTDTPSTEIALPFDAFMSAPTTPTPLPAGSGKLGTPLARMHTANLTASACI